MNQVIVLGTMDTKRIEYEYLCNVLRQFNLQPLIIDISCLDDKHNCVLDYCCKEVAKKSGVDFEQLKTMNRLNAGKVMIEGAKKIIREIFNENFKGIIAIGGANGTYMACEVMKILPLGFPKIMISVIAAGNPRENAGTSDIILYNTIVDTYLNAILKTVIINAVTSLTGMINYSNIKKGVLEGKKKLCISTLGLIQKCLDNIRDVLEENGWELLIFHANGVGGIAMENIISTQTIDGIIELALNEIINNIVGGVFNAGSGRLEAAINKKIPMLIVPGCIDFVNFWGKNIPTRFKDRTFIFHNEQNTLMRTNVEENMLLAKNLAVLIPTQGFSGNDFSDKNLVKRKHFKVGWYNEKTNKAFMTYLEKYVTNSCVKIRRVNAHINDEYFSKEVLKEFQCLVN
jgi:uncharacterized protein (UPF0261 family)